MSTTEQTQTLATLAEQLRGELITPGDAAYEEARRIWNGTIDRRPAAIARVQGAVDVVAVVELRARDGHRAGRARRRPLVRRLLDRRRRDRARLLAHEGRLGRPAREDRVRAGRRALGRRRPRDAGTRARRSRRPDLAHRHRGPHARRRHRLALAPVRADDRQPALGRARHGRRAPRHGLGDREPGPVLGAARRLGQLRRRRLVRVPPARRRPARARRPAPLRARRRGGGAAQRPRLLPRRARRGLALARADARAAGAAVPGGALGHAGAGRSSPSAPTSSAGRRCSSR